MNIIADNFFWVVFLAGFNLLLAISGYIVDKLSQRKRPATAATVSEARQNKMSPLV